MSRLDTWRRSVALAALGGLLVACAGTASDAGPPPAPDRPIFVRVAAVQTPSTFAAPEWNRDQLEKLVREAAAGGARIVVLPECAITGYLSQDLVHNWHVSGRPLERAFEGRDPAPFAETVPGTSTERFGALADELDIYLTIPFLEVEHRPAGPVYFNTVCLAAPDGEIVAHYRKLTPWPYPEKSWATAGDRGVQTYDTEYGRVGLAICFDIHTILDRYRDHDLWALLYPIAWVSEYHPERWFNSRLPVLVRQAGFNVIGANWSVERPVRWFGHGFSTIICADGSIAAQGFDDRETEIVFADLLTASPSRERRRRNADE